MKTLILYTVLLLLVSCKNSETNKDITVLHPLLERNKGLKNGKEWENIHNLYTRYTNDLRKNPNNAKTHAELAELFMMEARVTGEHGHYYSNALQLLDKANSLAGDNKDMIFRTLSDKASVYLSLHQFENGKRAAEEAIKLNPYNAQVYGALVDANVELGNYTEGVHMADKMNSIRPDIRSYSRVSYLREIYGDLNGAIDAMKQAVEAGYPGYEETSWAGLQLAELYRKNEDDTSAEMQLLSVLQERPSYAFAKAALAEIKMDQNDYTSADSLLADAIALMPEVGFYITKAKLYSMQGMKEEARKLSEEVIAMLKDDEASGHKMDLTYATVYNDLIGDQDKALEYAMKEYKVRPNNIEVNKTLTAIYNKMGNMAKANEHKMKSSIEKM